MTDSEKLSSLYAELEQEMPPEHLDKQILAASRRNADPTTRSGSVPTGSWRKPALFASMAAMVMLSLLLVPLMLNESGGPLDSRMMQQDQSVPLSKTIAPASTPTRAPQPRIQRAKRAAEPARGFAEVQSVAEEAHEAVPAEEVVVEKSIEDEASSPAAAEKSVASKAGESPPAEEWLAEIRQLMTSKPEEARHQMETFLKTYPEYNIEGGAKSTIKPAIPRK
ncbi:MAG: hypothetical protein V3W04_10685 [Gammaproteobacteria bacterium]